MTGEWLTMLHEGSRDMNSRYAVFSFLAGFWRQDYESAMQQIQQPTLIVMGKEASTIDRSVAKQVDSTSISSANKRVKDYLENWHSAEDISISGRNVLPYESVSEFTKGVKLFVDQIAVTS